MDDVAGRAQAVGVALKMGLHVYVANPGGTSRRLKGAAFTVALPTPAPASPTLWERCAPGV